MGGEAPWGITPNQTSSFALLFRFQGEALISGPWRAGSVAEIRRGRCGSFGGTAAHALVARRCANLLNTPNNIYVRPLPRKGCWANEVLFMSFHDKPVLAQD